VRSSIRLLGWATLAAGVGVTAAHIAYRGLGQQFAIFDFAAYYYAAVRLAAGHALYPQLSGDFTIGDLGLYLYPPPVAVAFLPFTVLPIEVASVIWSVLLLALAAAVIGALTRGVDPQRRPLAAGLLVLSIPLQTEVANGNLTLATLALLLGVWSLRRRPAASGVLLAVALLVKLLPGLAVPFLIVAGRSRIVGAALLALAVLVVGGWPWLGAAWLDYARLLQFLAASPHVASQTQDMVPAMFSVGPGRYALIGAVVLLAAYAGQRARSAPERADLAFALVVAAAPLVSSFVFYPYLVLSLPLAVRLCFIEGGSIRLLSFVGLAITDLPSPPAPSATSPLIGLLLMLAAGVVGISRPSANASVPALRTVGEGSAPRAPGAY